MQSLKRRNFLTTSGVATLSAATFGLIAGMPRIASAMGSTQARDVDILNVALGLEHEAINAYQLGAQSGLLQKPVLDAAVLFQSHHKGHRDALMATIEKMGGRPVAELQFCDYSFNTIDLLKVAGNQRWAGAGHYEMPIVVMTPNGSGIRGSLYHSHSFESWASRLAGWKVVMPSNSRLRA